MYSFNEIASKSPTWLDELRCSTSGIEGRLIDCRTNAIGVEDCSHTQDVALVCTESKQLLENIAGIYPLYMYNPFIVYLAFPC